MLPIQHSHLRAPQHAKRQSEEGSRHPVSPLGTLDGSAGSMGAGGRNLTAVLFGCLRHRTNRDEDAAFGFGVELYLSMDECEQRVILADADIGAGVPFGAALARDDIAGQ